MLSKIYERLVLTQLLEYLENKHALNGNNSGFRKGHSTISVLLRIRDDIIKAMKKGEVTLIAFADFSKAFDTVDYAIVLKKLHEVGFSRGALYWVLNYLTERKQFVQVNEKQSETASVEFGIPQGSILGPTLFNLYVNDLQTNCSSTCTQYADDTTLYEHSTPKDLKECERKLNKTMSSLDRWASESNLALNSKKTKQLLVTTPQMSRVHKLDSVTPSVKVNGVALERVKEFKLLGIWITENLKWTCHIKKLVSSCYGILSTLRKLKNLAPFHVKKLLVESLILSKLDYCDVVCYPLPLYLQKKLQRLQNAALSFVTKRYSKEKDILNLGWLPVKERTEYRIFRLMYKSLHSSEWPQYLKLKQYDPRRRLRSSQAPTLEIPLEKGTFQDSCAALYNELPSNIRNIMMSTDFKLFNRSINDLLKTRAMERLTLNE